MTPVGPVKEAGREVLDSFFEDRNWWGECKAVYRRWRKGWRFARWGGRLGQEPPGQRGGTWLAVMPISPGAIWFWLKVRWNVWKRRRSARED